MPQSTIQKSRVPSARPQPTRTSSPKSTWNRNAIRRHLRREEVSPDGVVRASCKSMTRPDVKGQEQKRYEITINLNARTCQCNCRDFTMRRSKGGLPVSFRWPHLWCKHLEKAMINAERHGEVELFYNDDGSLFEAIPTGFVATKSQSFDAPIPVEAYDREHEDYLDELEARAELSAWIHGAPFNA